MGKKPKSRGSYVKDRQFRPAWEQSDFSPPDLKAHLSRGASDLFKGQEAAQKEQEEE